MPQQPSPPPASPLLRNSPMKRLLKLLAPYLAVSIFWCIFSNGWLAILAYHAQVLFWNRRSLKGLRWPHKKRWLFAALPTIIAGPLVWVLLPHITHSELGAWLTEYKLTRVSLLLMVPYFGIIHPVLEQLHWEPLREQTPAAHFFFAGYHMLVLGSLITIPWIVFCFVALTVTSVIWQHLTHRADSLYPATLAHILADLGIILTAYLIVSI